ncbi:MAG: mannose-6-phosphate isomerase, class I [Ignavibacteriaceae bacterium]
MKKFHAQPYRLINKVQHYDWGTKDENAFIPKFLGVEAKPGLSYAELWIGAHPKCPSEIVDDNVNIPLNKFVKDYPVECLGDYVVRRFNDQFPFLLKVLSSDKALSIQTHPNKIQAEKLHALDPQNYPDDNHKPEIAIAVDSLAAIAGFRPTKEIVQNLISLPELNDYIGEDLIAKVLNSKNDQEIEKNIQGLYSEIMKRADESEILSKCIPKIAERLKNKSTLLPEEFQFLKQYDLFGVDIGLLSFFFFNIIYLEKGQAIFTQAGVPHAYIKGNIIECMANSDNVVRAGLTNKFKDVKTLLDIIKYDFAKYDIINEEQKEDEVTYKTIAEEFQVSHYQKKGSYVQKKKSEDKLAVYLITDGTIEIVWKSGGIKSSLHFIKGESIFIPAALSEYEITITSSAEYYLVEIPS